MRMGDVVKIVECPRDAWQGLRVEIPAETKAAYLLDLIEAGCASLLDELASELAPG